MMSAEERDPEGFGTQQSTTGSPRRNVSWLGVIPDRPLIGSEAQCAVKVVSRGEKNGYSDN